MLPHRSTLVPSARGGLACPMSDVARFRSQLNLPLVIGLAMLAIGFLIANYLALATYEAMPAIETPSTQNDNLAAALPYYIIQILFQAAGPLLLYLFGLSLAAVGAVTALVGLIQVLVRWFRRREASRN